MSGKINLKGDFKNSGFGFSCMQQAVNLNITGKFEYLQNNEVEIISFGNKESIRDFFDWALKQQQTVSGNLELSSTKIMRSNEFHIINQL